MIDFEEMRKAYLKASMENLQVNLVSQETGKEITKIQFSQEETSFIFSACDELDMSIEDLILFSLRSAVKNI